MPTIEIASIDSKALGLNQSDFEVAITEESKLESHRGLFNDRLRQENGVIIHIGNPEFVYDKEGGYFAGSLIDWDFEPEDFTFPALSEILENEDHDPDYDFKFKFLDKYKKDMDKLLNLALEHSPVDKIYFLTDYQFGPEEGKIEVIDSISDFWERHESEGLNLNTLYEMHRR